MKFIPRPKSTGIGAESFLKIGDREQIKGVFRGDPYTFKKHWPQDGGSGMECQGKGCPDCAKGSKPKFRFYINFIRMGADGLVPMIWEQAGAVYDQLAELHEGGYDLSKTVVMISRKGTGTDTTYTILPSPKDKVTPDIEKKLKAIKLHAFGQAQEPEESDAQEPAMSEEDVPF